MTDRGQRSVQLGKRLLAALFLVAALSAPSEDLDIAVAAKFFGPLKQLAP